jgi:hypothetical protein
MRDVMHVLRVRDIQLRIRSNCKICVYQQVYLWPQAE